MRRDDGGSDGVSVGTGIAVRETDMALLVNLESDGETWIPKSVIHDDSEVYKDGQNGDVVVKKWWAEKQGLV